MNRRIPLAIASLALLAAGYGVGQIIDQHSQEQQAQIKRADPGQLSSLAAQLADEFLTKQSVAKSAAQVSQAVDEASLLYHYMLVKQNDELIRLQRKIAGESK